jgi:hypothetical protein
MTRLNNSTSRSLSLIAILSLTSGCVFGQELGYAWYDGTGISSAFSFNPSGQPITVQNTATGAYTVTFAGNSAIPGNGGGGHIQVTAYGTSIGQHCKVLGWGANYNVFVRCFDRAGNPANSLFTISLIQANNTKNISYAWVDSPTAATSTPSSTYARSAGTIAVSRIGTGNYNVQFAGLNAQGGTVQVTAYGADSASCQAERWTSPGLTATVTCRTAVGPADSQFTIAVIPAGATPPGIGFAWAHNSTAANYTPEPIYSYNPGGSITASSTSTGSYHVAFNGLNQSGRPGGTVHVTAYDPQRRCSVLAWSPDMTVSVACVDSAGAPANSRFSILVIAPIVPPTPLGYLSVSPVALQFNYRRGDTLPPTQAIAVSAAPSNTAFTVDSSISAPWLTVSPTNGTTPANVIVTVNPVGLAAGIATANVHFRTASGNVVTTSIRLTVTDPPVVPNTLTATPAALIFNGRVGGAVPTPQTVALTLAPSPNASITVELPSVPWLVASLSGTTTPANLTVAINTFGISSGIYSTQLIARAGGAVLAIPVTFNLAAPTDVPSASNTNQILSHVADSEGWQTTIVLVNQDTQPAPFTLRFYGSQTTNRSAGSSLSLNFEGIAGRTAIINGTIPVGGSRTIQTAGNDSALNMGWVELVTDRAISGLSVFRSINDSQEAAVGLTKSFARFQLPFDNTNGRITSFALVNSNPTQAASVAVVLRDESGNLLGSGSVALSVRGHLATEVVSQWPFTAGMRGVVEFSTSAADITGLGLRFDQIIAGRPRAFTSFPIQGR